MPSPLPGARLFSSHEEQANRPRTKEKEMQNRTNSETKAGSRALVIGGSMAGLIAARILVERFERVKIIERDRFPVEPAPRKGVPQASHQHVMLKRGTNVLERLFPVSATNWSPQARPWSTWRTIWRG